MKQEKKVVEIKAQGYQPGRAGCTTEGGTGGLVTHRSSAEVWVRGVKEGQAALKAEGEEVRQELWLWACLP